MPPFHFCPQLGASLQSIRHGSNAESALYKNSGHLQILRRLPTLLFVAAFGCPLAPSSAKGDAFWGVTDFFIYRLPNLTLLLDSECFASGWVRS